MSKPRNNIEEDYENTRKGIDLFQEEDIDDGIEEEEQNFDVSYEDTGDIYTLLQSIKEYTNSQGLLLCENLNGENLAEFLG